MEMVLSLEPVQMLFVYGCHTTAFTESMWPLKVCLHRPLFASQRRAEWSREHDTMKSPVSWKAASHTACQKAQAHDSMPFKFSIPCTYQKEYVVTQ